MDGVVSTNTMVNKLVKTENSQKDKTETNNEPEFGIMTGVRYISS